MEPDRSAWEWERIRLRPGAAASRPRARRERGCAMEAFADVAVLSRIQFALTVAYHFLFVPLSIGLGLDSGHQRDPLLPLAQTTRTLRRRKFWVKVFTATFAIGVATGITMEFSFGTNWADYSRFVGDIFGAPLAAEALFAFFLESVFLGVLLFGRKRVEPEVLHGVRVARVAGVVPVGAVDPHRELVDADAGRRRAWQPTAPRPSSPTSLPAAFEPVHLRALHPHGGRAAHHGRVRGHGRGRRGICSRASNADFAMKTHRASAPWWAS